MLKLQIKYLNCDRKNTRTILVSSEMDAVELHHMINALYGLDDDHLWDFTCSKRSQIIRVKPSWIIKMDEEAGFFDFFDVETLLAEDIKIKDIFTENLKKWEYCYDYVADHTRSIEFKGYVEKDTDSPQCLKCEGNFLLENENYWGLDDWMKIYETQNKREFQRRNDKIGGSFESRDDFVEYLAPLYENFSCEDLNKKMEEASRVYLKRETGNERKKEK